MAGRVDHRHDHKTEGRGNPGRAERASAFGVERRSAPQPANTSANVAKALREAAASERGLGK
jgi:hypothetical protein